MKKNLIFLVTALSLLLPLQLHAESFVQIKTFRPPARVSGHDPVKMVIKPATPRQMLKGLNGVIFKDARRVLNTMLQGAAVAKRAGKELQLVPGNNHQGAVYINGTWIGSQGTWGSKPTTLKPGDVVRVERNVKGGKVQVKESYFNGSSLEQLVQTGSVKTAKLEIKGQDLVIKPLGETVVGLTINGKRINKSTLFKGGDILQSKIWQLQKPVESTKPQL